MDKQKRKIGWFFAYIFVTVLIGVLLFPIFVSLSNEEGIRSLESLVDGMGCWGIFLLLFVQILQIVIAIIPGEVIEFVSGAMYGTFGGLLIDLIGVAVGETLIYFLVSHLGSGVAEKIAGSEKIQKLRFLKKERNIELLLFFLFFIPGTPKDTLCYVAPLFKIRYKPFILISVFARIPSIMSSTYAGATFSNGDMGKTVIIYAAIAVVSVAGILLNQYLMKRREARDGTER